MRTKLWHFAFAHWYDHEKAGHRARARAWGVISDSLCRVLDVVGWGSTDGGPACQRAPRGWWCSRQHSHTGPCAARPRWWNLRHRMRRIF